MTIHRAKKMLKINLITYVTQLPFISFIVSDEFCEHSNKWITINIIQKLNWILKNGTSLRLSLLSMSPFAVI